MSYTVVGLGGLQWFGGEDRVLDRDSCTFQHMMSEWGGMGRNGMECAVGYSRVGGMG